MKNLGWRVIANCGKYTILNNEDNTCTPYVAAFAYDKSDNTWGQGHYFHHILEVKDYCEKVCGVPVQWGMLRPDQACHLRFLVI